MHAVSLFGSEDLPSEPDPKWMCLNCNLVNHRLTWNFSLGGVVNTEALSLSLYIYIYIFVFFGHYNFNL